MGLSPSKPPSLTENFPHNPAISEAKIWFVFRKWRGYGGSFFVFGEVEIFCSVRLSHAFCGWEAVRHDTLRVCRQAESRHSSKVSSPNASLLPIGCEAAPYKAFAPPVPNKNFPQEHPHHTKRNKFSPCKGGCSWGKFWEGQGGLEGRRPSPKEGLLRLQGLPYLSSEIFL